MSGTSANCWSYNRRCTKTQGWNPKHYGKCVQGTVQGGPKRSTAKLPSCYTGLRKLVKICQNSYVHYITKLRTS